MTNTSILTFLETQGIDGDLIGILDVGAVDLDHSARKEYASLMEAGRARVVGFEPDPDGCQVLNDKYNRKNTTFYPYYIGDGTEQAFHVNRALMTSSLYESNMELLTLFNNIGELCSTVKSIHVSTKRIDDLHEIDFPIDFIKMDIQGAELQALEGAAETLLDTVVIQSEVEWVPLYKNQPLFSEVELFLRSRGFVVHKILEFGTRPFKPFIFQKNPNIGNQILWSEVVFVKDFCNLESLTDRQLLSYAIIMHEIYGSIDLSTLVLKTLGNRLDAPLGDAYNQWLHKVVRRPPEEA